MKPVAGDNERQKTANLTMWLGAGVALVLILFVAWIAFAPRDGSVQSASQPPRSETSSRPAPGAVIPDGNTGSGQHQPGTASDSAR